jgi:putative glutamine amidotransferase
MCRQPLILISPDIESAGKEFADTSISLSVRYQHALVETGALPLTMPATIDRQVIAELVRRSDGVLISGGDDIEPRLYGAKLPARVRQTVGVTPDGGERDYRELLLIDEVFRKAKPYLGICRGHQMLNVALGGTMVADIPSQLPRAANHRRNDRRNDLVHDVRLTSGSQLARITGRQKLGVNSTHHQAVGRVAAPLQVVARSSDGVVEGLELKPGAVHCLPFLLSVQFHPERLMDRYPEHRAIFAAFVQACARHCQKDL